MAVLIATMCATFSAVVAVYLSFELHRTRSLLVKMHTALTGAKIIVDAYVEQGIGLVCGVCGNQMSATERVDIVERSDGTFVPAHPSHQLHTWEK